MTSTSSNNGRPFVLVVGVDLDETDSSGYALDQATRIASRVPCSEMHVLHVAGAHESAEVARETAGLLKLYVAEKAAMLGGLSQRSVGVHVREGEAPHEIAELASEVGADMIIVGAHRTSSLKDLFAGSTAQRLMGMAKCPVLVAGPRPHAQPSHIITIEPPCPACVDARAGSQGRTWWCPRHSESHHLRHHHVYSYLSQLPFAEHESQMTPNGV